MEFKQEVVELMCTGLEKVTKTLWPSLTHCQAESQQIGPLTKNSPNTQTLNEIGCRAAQQGEWLNQKAI